MCSFYKCTDFIMKTEETMRPSIPNREKILIKTLFLRKLQTNILDGHECKNFQEN